MLKILVPIVAMVAGVIGGILIGARHRRGASESGVLPDWLRGTWGRILPVTRRLVSSVWSLAKRLARVGKALGRSIGARMKSASVAERGKQGAEKLRQCLDHVGLPKLTQRHSIDRIEEHQAVDTTMLNCRARIGREPDGESWRSVLIIDLCGTIESPGDGHEVYLDVALHDVTDEPAQRMPVLNRPKAGPIQPTSEFAFQTDMGKLCRRATVLEDWTSVAKISPEWFVLPRQGHRSLQFSVAIASRETDARLAAATCVAPYENIEIGYLDVEDNIQRAKTLAVGLAFSVAAAKNELLDCEIDVIHGWVRTNFGSADVSSGARLELERALQKTAAFFRRGGQLNVRDICTEVVEIAPMVGRLDILDLCLRVAGAKGQVTAPELNQLKNLAAWLQVDRSRLRTMVEKRLPVSMHQSQDEEMILGVTTDMSSEEARRQLNREYAKWSSRVISSDPAIRKQADQMLNLIANARTQYVGVKVAK
ncbi:MAG: hypothetical protein JW993_03930 [Sedimentisphaerales bacterium]|nr:hypothetical protein [Sedimentisphaerales bacterium]